MSKTMKKLLSMALTLAMAVTSLGITAMADEETTETAAPAQQSSYESDSYYQKALALCSSLGIIKGYDDGSVNPESTITRAEMSAIVLRTLNVVASEKYDGKMKVGKVNSDENGNLAGRYNIMSIPSFLIFKNGEVIDSVTGAMSADALAARLDAAL